MGSSDGRKGSGDKHPIKHVSREDYQEFLAARCIKNLGSDFSWSNADAYGIQSVVRERG
jgi:hypothetical protein